MAGRGKPGGRVGMAKLLATLQKNKDSADSAPPQQPQPSQPRPTEPSQPPPPEPSPPPPPELSQSPPPQTPEPEPGPSEKPASEQASSDPESASETGTDSPATSSPVLSSGGTSQHSRDSSPSRSGSPEKERQIRGKLRRYLVRKTPPDSPRSRSPELSESDDSSANTDSTAQSSPQSETGESTPASGQSTAASGSPVPSVTSETSHTSSTEAAVPSGPAVLKPIENKIVGKEGDRMRVAVNYMKINIKQKKKIHLYAVFFEPNIDSIPLRRKILNSPEIIARIGSTINFTGSNLFLPVKLDQDPCVISATHPTTNTGLEVTIQYVKEPPTEELANFYNNMFNKVMRAMQLVELNLHHYNPLSKIDVPAHKLEVWPGYVCAVQEYDGGLMLNVDTSHRVLRKTTAREMLHDIFSSDQQNFVAKANKLLVGAIVLTRYNNRAYRIDDIDFKSTPMSKFTMKEGQEITFVDYFKQQWGVEIKDLRQPLLVNRPRQRRNQTEAPPLILLVPELSYLTGLTDDIRSDHRVMKDLASHTKIAPDVKYRRLVEFIQQASTKEASKKILDDWGLEIDPRPLETTARRFPIEKLTLGNGVECSVGDRADWGMKLRDASVLSAKHVKRWYFIYNARDRPKAEEFLKSIQTISRKLGFSFDNPRRQELKDDITGSYRKALQEVDRSAELIVIMTPGSSQREDRYAAIKQLCCVDLGIPSQVVRVSTLTPNKFRAVVQNIAMQIACKQGGQLWSINMPLPNAMYIGLDSYHDPGNKARSVVGFVSSLNKNATQWYSRCYFQTRREEIVSMLGPAITSALRKYSEANNGTIPNKIFIYRDGVGDGDLPTVRDYEVVQIQEALENYVKNKPNLTKPQLTFVVVQKRVNAKIMQLNGRNLANPPPGTVIDHTITRRQFYDFYLISQHVHQGTVTPTHYISLTDECNLGPDKLQRLSYKMTHLYYNFPATIRVPAPCQYAHKLAFLMGQYVKSAANEVLHDKLYYL